MTTPLTKEVLAELLKLGAGVHWSFPIQPDVADLVVRYAATPRKRLGFGDRTDFALANGQFMVDRDSLELIVFQTAAKERIRWLAVQLAIMTAERDALLAAHR